MVKNHFQKLFAFFWIGFLLWWLSPPIHARASTLAVNTTTDTDDGLCDTRHCSLREAIQAANANPGPDEIIFLFGEGGIHTIFPETPLPPFLDNGTTLDGTRSPYFGGVPLTVLDFRALERGAGLVLATDDNVVRGLSIVGTETVDGIYVDGSRNRIEGNYIGVEPTGTARGNQAGIRFYSTGSDNMVIENLISGNEVGIQIYSDHQTILGNWIGLNPAGTSKLGDQVIGIEIFSDGNRIGSESPESRNVISGHYTGIYIHMHADSNSIMNNYIGTNAEGTAAVPNSLRGIHVIDSQQNAIGGDEPGTGNLISGNGTGIYSCSGMLFIRGNKIGTDASGSLPIPNNIGIDFSCAGEGSIIGGGTLTSVQNLIAFNTAAGINVDRALNFSIENNVITRNGGDGISIFSASSSDEGTKITITQNRIFSNGGLGIIFHSNDVNRGIAPPVITGAASLYASGTSCTGCRVELFLADPDPSGYGEGKTYLTSANALSDGTFMIRFSDIGACQQLTATATDTFGNTSEFSRNAGVGLCARIPPLAAWVWVLGGAGAGSGLMLVITFLPRRRQGGSLARIGFVFLGGLLGAGIAIGILAFPIVHVERRQEQPGGQAPSTSPSCGQFIDEALLLPEDGKTFDPGTDVLFELSPQPDPPGFQTRWLLEVTGPDKTSARRLLTSNSIRLSELGFDPRQTGFYLWTLKGERSQAGSNLWTPLCTDSVQRMFQIAAPQPVQPAATATVAPNGNTTTTATPTLTLTISAPTATLLQNGICRRGPGTEYDAVTTIPNGSNVPIVGRNQDSSWWQVQVPGTQTMCWLADGNVETSGDTNQVPMVEVEPSACWVKQQQGPDKCVAPCPQGAQPGGVCTP
jgi:CSLREA domain-containing protein